MEWERLDPHGAEPFPALHHRVDAVHVPHHFFDEAVHEHAEVWVLLEAEPSFRVFAQKVAHLLVVDL